MIEAHANVYAHVDLVLARVVRAHEACVVCIGGEVGVLDRPWFLRAPLRWRARSWPNLFVLQNVEVVRAVGHVPHKD